MLRLCTSDGHAENLGRGVLPLQETRGSKINNFLIFASDSALLTVARIYKLYLLEFKVQILEC